MSDSPTAIMSRPWAMAHWARRRWAINHLGAQLATCACLPMHGPELANWSHLSMGIMPRLCECGAVETGHLHPWHDRNCTRFGS